MKEENKNVQMIIRCSKVLAAAYAVTAVLLLLLASGVYKMGIPEKVVAIAIVLIYILSCLFAGFLIGKVQKNKKFIWGLLMGTAYFLVLLIVTGILNKGISEIASDAGTTLFICLGSGMLGGMIS